MDSAVKFFLLDDNSRNVAGVDYIIYSQLFEKAKNFFGARDETVRQANKKALEETVLHCFALLSNECKELIDGGLYHQRVSSFSTTLKKIFPRGLDVAFLR